MENGDKVVKFGNEIISMKNALDYVMGKTKDLVIFPDQPNNSTMRIIRVPLIIFKEVSDRFGDGKLATISVMMGGSCQMQLLKKDHKNIGFPGAIGFRLSKDASDFLLWSLPPEGKPESVFEPRPILELTGRIEEAGAWASGRGNLMREMLRASFPINGIPIIKVNILATRFLSIILYRASQLAADSRITADKFWQADRYPGDYTDYDDGY